MSKNDLANPNNITADDNEKPTANYSNEKNEQSEEYIDLLSRNIEGSNKVLNNHLRQCGFEVVTR